MEEHIKIEYIVNDTTTKRIFRGKVDAHQIMPGGIGNVRFVEFGTDVVTGQKVVYFTARNCETITRYLE